MARFYSLIIALLARLIMIAFGGLLLWSASFYARVLADPASRRVLLSDPIQQAGTNWSGVSFVLAMGIGCGVVGLLLLFFGLRGLWRRLAAGLPSEDEHAATQGGRLGSAAIFGAGALLGLLRLSLLIYGVGDEVMLRWTGVHANAVVERKWYGDWARPGSAEPKHFAYVLEIAFPAPDGSTLRMERPVSGTYYHDVAEGGVVPVTYAPGDPGDARLQFIGGRRILVEIFIWVGLISAGLWGLRRNLGWGDGGGTRARPSPPQPAGATLSARGAAQGGSPIRRKFGQRTL